MSQNQTEKEVEINKTIEKKEEQVQEQEQKVETKEKEETPLVPVFFPSDESSDEYESEVLNGLQAQFTNNILKEEEIFNVCKSNFQYHKSPIKALSVSNNHILAVSEDKVCCVWDLPEIPEEKEEEKEKEKEKEEEEEKEKEEEEEEKKEEEKEQEQEKTSNSENESTQTKKPLSIINDHTTEIVDASFDCFGEMYATAERNAKIFVYDTKTSEKIATLEGPYTIEWIRWHPKGPVLVAGSSIGNTWMWMIKKRQSKTNKEKIRVKVQFLGTFSGHSGCVNCGEWSNDGQNVITCGEDCSTKVWWPKTAECLVTWSGPSWHKNPINIMTIAHNDMLMLTGDTGGYVKLVHLPKIRILSTFKVANVPILSNIWEFKNEKKYPGFSRVTAIEFIRPKPWFVSGCLDGNLRIFDMNSSQTRQKIQFKSEITKIVTHPENLLIHVAFADGNILTLDSRNGKIVKKFQKHKSRIIDMKLDLSRNQIYSCDNQGVVYSFEL
ncbi:division protein 1-related [Anaeramoeba flamelloides]|uniref:Division protein 1-related n=1 Tax=Anaeramoeba flamelloides TaxID=1746091 RepID=A0AAV7ZEN7_9EUKA|nr:division protein 1-related [Anaeramoeba flamelloides]